MSAEPEVASAPFGIVHGGRDLVEVLEDALERAKSGELVGIVLCGVTANNHVGWHGAFVAGTPHVWARLVASLSSAQNELLTEGVGDWS